MRACRFHQRMVVRLGCSCRISIFGRVPNGSGDSALWKRISAASGSHLATTIMATPGKSSDMTVTETAAQPVRRTRVAASSSALNTLTRKQPAGWMGRRGRIDKALLAETCVPPQQNPKIFVCGSTPFVEDVSRFLVELGHDPLTIKTERFGPSGGQAS